MSIIGTSSSKKVAPRCSMQPKMFSRVMLLKPSSLTTAKRIEKVGNSICAFKKERPVIIPSAIGRTAVFLIEAEKKAVRREAASISEIEELNLIKDLHRRIVKELRINPSPINKLLEELEEYLKSISKTKVLNLYKNCFLVSFGERMSALILEAYLKKRNVETRQCDGFDYILKTDSSANAKNLNAAYHDVAKKLHKNGNGDHAVPILIGFPAKEWKTGVATTIKEVLQLGECEVWKDVYGVLTCDPSIHVRGEDELLPHSTAYKITKCDKIVDRVSSGPTGVGNNHDEIIYPVSSSPTRVGNNLVEVDTFEYECKLAGSNLEKNFPGLGSRMSRVGFLVKVWQWTKKLFEPLGISSINVYAVVRTSLTIDRSKPYSGFSLALLNLFKTFKPANKDITSGEEGGHPRAVDLNVATVNNGITSGEEGGHRRAVDPNVATVNNGITSGEEGGHPRAVDPNVATVSNGITSGEEGGRPRAVGLNVATEPDPAIRNVLSYTNLPRVLH